MTRIATYASNTLLLNYISGTNNRLQDEQIQLTTGKVSQTYQGISASSQRLITFENTHASLDQFMKNNTTAEIRLDLTATALEGIRDTIRDFEEELQRYQSSAVKDRNANNQLQSAAFRGLLSMVSYMNTQADGRYIFAGGRTDVPPADLTVSTLAAFQAAYNGSTVTFPTTRDANLENFSISADGDNYSNWLTFARSNGASPPLGRITATTAQFANVNVGAKITVSGTTSNNGTYTVKAVDAAGKYIDIVTEMLTDETSAPISVTYPDPNQANVTLSVSGTATFSRSGDTITYGSGTMADIPVGSAFTVAGSTNNNGTYTVASNSGGVITIVSKKLTDEGTTAAFQNTAAANVTFTNVGAAGTDTIAFPAGAIAALPATPAVGSTFKITGAGTYDGTYTVKSIAGDTITVDENITATSTLTDNAITAVFGPVAYFQKSVDTTANTLTFTNNTAPTKGTIASTIAGFFDTLKSGMRIKLTGSSSTNGDNDTYTIDSVSSDGKTITIKEDLPAATVTDTTDMVNFLVLSKPGTIAASSYYKGDNINLTHRPSTTREIEMNLNAASAVFEKAFRAMGLIAQGTYQSEGGLDQNGTRISQALYLTRSSLYVTAQGTPPFGTEQTGSIEATQEDLGFKQVLLKETNDFHETYRGYLENSMAKIENIDKNEVISHILDDTRTLEASYQTLARIRQLSLVNFLI